MLVAGVEGFVRPDDAEREIELLRGVVDFLDRIRRRRGPTDAELEEAPFLDHWGMITARQPRLIGLVSGHPELPGDDRAISTSALFVVDAERRWARTLYRLYRLGQSTDPLGLPGDF